MLHRLQRSGREIRYWFASNGDVVGVWQSKTGKTYAVGHNHAGHTIVYRGCSEVFQRHVPDRAVAIQAAEEALAVAL
jgi:hypothetical protein